MMKINDNMFGEAEQFDGDYDIGGDDDVDDDCDGDDVKHKPEVGQEGKAVRRQGGKGFSVRTRRLSCIGASPIDIKT